MDKKENNKKNKKTSLYLLILLIGLLLISVAIYGLYMINKAGEDEEKNISYTNLLKEITDENVEKIEMTVGSTSIKVKLKGQEDEKSAIVPSTQAFIELIQNEKIEKGNEIDLIQKQQNVFLKIPTTLLSLLPTLMMVALFVLIFKMQGLGDKGKVYDGVENKTDIKFDDVAGLDEEKAELVEIVDFLKEPKRFHKMGAKIPKGILLYGKPGTGKTLIAKAIAGEAGVPFISMSGSEFIEMFAGLGASRVRKLFEKARKISPCIVFIDEIDAIGSRRTSNSGAESENNQTLNQLLVEMDGFEKNEKIILL